MITAIPLRYRLLAALLLPLLANACATTQSVQQGADPQFMPVMPVNPIPPERNNGAIFQVNQTAGLFQDDKAGRVGDILIVRLVERTQARKSANTSTSRDSSLDLPNPVLFGRDLTAGGGRPLLDTRIDSSRSFEGQGNSAQSNQLDGQIAVTVAEVLANGNLVVQGEKWIQLNQGEEYIRLRGIVRPVDIRSDNTVLSTQVANTQVAYGGRGSLADSNRAGWLTRFFDSPIWPF